MGLGSSPKGERKKDPLTSWLQNKTARTSQDLKLQQQQEQKVKQILSASSTVNNTAAGGETATQVPPANVQPAPKVDPLDELLAKIPDLSFMLSTTLVRQNKV